MSDRGVNLPLSASCQPTGANGPDRIQDLGEHAFKGQVVAPGRRVRVGSAPACEVACAVGEICCPWGDLEGPCSPVGEQLVRLEADGTGGVVAALQLGNQVQVTGNLRRHQWPNYRGLPESLLVLSVVDLELTWPEGL
jgi:hypothetical protein